MNRLKMIGYFNQHPIWSGCFLLATGVGVLLLLLYLINYFTGIEL